MSFKNYYTILGVAENSSNEEIKKQFRRMAKKYHPDVSKETDAEEKFKEAKEAYEVLKDKEKRAQYDQLLKHGGATNNQPPPNWNYQSSSSRSTFNEEEYSDFFEQLFGQAAQARHYQQQNIKTPGQNQQAQINLSLEQAFHGEKTQITLKKQQLNPQTGAILLVPKSLNITIPPGVTERQKLRLKGQGQPGFNGGHPGDLYLSIHLLPHPIYKTDQKDILLTLPITPWEAALGAQVQIPTLGGKLNMKIPPDSQGGQRLRLKSRGLPGNPPGDQWIILRIAIPKAATEEQKKLYEACAKAMPDNPRTHLVT